MANIDEVAWFYSSLAQAAASIVGIIGAVFLTRLGDHRKAVAAARPPVRDRLMMREQEYSTYITDFRKPEFRSKNRIPASDVAMLEQAAGHLETLNGSVRTGQMAAVEKQLTSLAEAASGIWAQSKLKQVAEELHSVRREVESFRAFALPRPLVAVWCLFVVLSLFGVLWPLRELVVLPPNDRTIEQKTPMLMCFAAGICLFGLYLAYELFELHREGRFTWGRIEK